MSTLAITAAVASLLLLLLLSPPAHSIARFSPYAPEVLCRSAWTSFARCNAQALAYAAAASDHAAHGDPCSLRSAFTADSTRLLSRTAAVSAGTETDNNNSTETEHRNRVILEKKTIVHYQRHHVLI